MCFQNPNLQARTTIWALTKLGETAVPILPTSCRAAPSDAPSLALCSSLEPLMGFVGSSEGTAHSHGGRLDGPFHLSCIHLHKQSVSHPHAPVPIPPSRAHSQLSSSCPLSPVLTRALLAARVKTSNNINVGNKLKMPHCPARQHQFKKISFPQFNEMCLETLKIKRLLIHSWQQTRGLGQSKGLEQHKVLALFYQPSPD